MTPLDLTQLLPIACRAWTERDVRKRRKRRGRRRPALPTFQHALIFDTETTIDAAQGLLFGAFRYVRIDWTLLPVLTTVAEGLIYADDLPQTDPEGFARLQAYSRNRKPDVDMTYLNVEPDWQLGLWSRADFADRWLYRVGYPNGNMRDPALLVMFNAPFDLSRVAVDAAEARADMYGGFSLVIWADEHGDPAPWRPRITVKAIDSKRSLKKLTKLEREADDFTGHLLDLRTLVFALTGEGHSLDSAAATYGVRRKGSTTDLGTITEDSIDYCRQDVAVTTDVLEAAMIDYASHPIELQATKAYSPASIAKAYLRGMGIEPRLRRQPDFDRGLLGIAMSAFYGGRAEVHIRHHPLPVTLVDFTSMYPTVDQLLGLWRLVIADRVEAVDVTDEVNQLLQTITLEDCFDRERWADWVVIAHVVPDGDVLPIRGAYGAPALEADEQGRPAVNGWSIGVNPLHADQPMAYPLCDLIASKLHTGKTPRVDKAVRFVPVGGQQPGLAPLRLRGQVEIDPRTLDFFQRVVEARQEVKTTVRDHPDGCSCADCRLSWFLKILANAGSYGIFAEVVRHELARGSRETVQVHTGTGNFAAKVNAPEEPGEFCFPPIAACITGAARLMLTLLERSITDNGGTWMFCDTDSMAIVAIETGGLLACPGGAHRLPDGTEAVKALSYAEVDEIRFIFGRLNPYDRAKVPDLLKRELDGVCLAISAKRYAIWDTADPSKIGDMVPVKISQHGLGRYLDPVNPRTERRNDKGQLTWILESWRWVARAMAAPDAAMPTWSALTAVSRISVSSTTLWGPFRTWNAAKPWAEQIKPFNFLLVADIDPFGYPPGVDPQRFRLVAPYSSDPDEWARLEWRNLYDPDGPTYLVSTEWTAQAEPGVVIVKSYAQVLREYRLHPEHKFHGPDGTHCRRYTRGVLQRRPVHVLDTRRIGKEANNLDDVQAGLYGDLGDVLNEYADPSHSLFHHHVLPVLEHLSGRELSGDLGVDRRTIDRIRRGSIPRPKRRAALTELALSLVRDTLIHGGTETAVNLKSAAPIALFELWRQGLD